VLLDQVAVFEAVQHALYLPLGFSVQLGSSKRVRGCSRPAGRSIA